MSNKAIVVDANILMRMVCRGGRESSTTPIPNTRIALSVPNPNTESISPQRKPA